MCFSSDFHLVIVVLALAELKFHVMKNLWNQLLNELYQYDVDLDETFNPAAGEHEIFDAEAKLKVKLPDDFVEFYMIHNGQDEMSDNIIYGEEFLSLNRIIAEWKIWKQLFDSKKFEKLNSNPDKGVKNYWWNPLWIPFTYDGSGNYYCIDLDPDTNGIYGQVIRVLYDSPKRSIVANSFSNFIENYTNDLKNENYILDL